MGLPKWLIGGLIGAAVGGAVWVAVGYFLEAEVGYIAWGIGLLAGVGVRVMAQDDIGIMPGATAVVCAFAGVIAAKYMVVNLLVDNALANEELVTITSEDIIAGFADEVAEAREEAGKTVQWPAGMTFEDASTQYDYPQDIWQEAKARYDKLPPTEQQELIAEEQEMISSFMEIMSSEVKDAGFRESFGPFDLLWLGLAAFTAFKVGSAEAD